jgi:lipoyl(octanoyl) transferase
VTQSPLPTRHLGRLPYADTYQLQLDHHAQILADRDTQANPPGLILTVEHPPVITLSNRPGAADHILASEAELARQGVTLERTDRGGDVTYHGPGQLVIYPILDLHRLQLRLHDYLRLLEQAVIDTLATYSIQAHRDACATGVWIPLTTQPNTTHPALTAQPAEACSTSNDAKIAAIGIRVRKWVTLHGLALNITTNLDHFRLIVPCGLTRPVTSLERILETPPPFTQVRDDTTNALQRLLTQQPVS